MEDFLCLLVLAPPRHAKALALKRTNPAELIFPTYCPENLSVDSVFSLAGVQVGSLAPVCHILWRGAGTGPGSR